MEKETVRRLIDGELPWEQLRDEALQGKKDGDRFEKTIEILQERVEWDDTILMPINDHLFAVAKDGDRIVKGECDHEFGTLDENWKRDCQVRIREGEQEMTEIYPGWQSPDPDWDWQLREFFCPECYELLEVDAVPAGYPVLQEFEPDIDGFYEEWLDKPVPTDA